MKGFFVFGARVTSYFLGGMEALHLEAQMLL